MNKVIGMGNALVDVLMQVNDEAILRDLGLPKGSMQLVDSAMADKVQSIAGTNGNTRASGGSAANTIHGLAELGVATGFIGKVGRDDWGEFFRSDMVARNIHPFLLESNTESGRAMALITPDSERTFATFLGAAVEMTATDLPNGIFSTYNYFHIEGYLVQNRSLIEAALKMAKSNGLKISLDLASFNVVEDNLEFLQEMVAKYVDILFANEEEARVFTGGLEHEKALNSMSVMADIVVLKQGASGSLIKHSGTTVKIEAVKANVIDTTGAGDLYAAGFLYGLINGFSLEKCGRLGALLSARVIEVIGPKMDDKKWAEIRNAAALIVD
ncbi:adenosine kinase [Geofilum sp. OHC36d9]|uniref:adenosine kinase n=1 Tax=Geofilum sp. OHC36d9 TaxID=3458413 RepID=UPI00403487E3